MNILLDTDICIYLIKGTFPKLTSKIFSSQPTSIFLSSISYHELWHGVFKSKLVEKNSVALELFCSSFNILPFETKAARCSARIRSQLEAQGKTIGALDLLIAGHAQSENLKLITRNTREFSRVQKLKVENWVD